MCHDIVVALRGLRVQVLVSVKVLEAFIVALVILAHSALFRLGKVLLQLLLACDDVGFLRFALRDDFVEHPLVLLETHVLLDRRPQHFLPVAILDIRFFLEFFERAGGDRSDLISGLYRAWLLVQGCFERVRRGHTVSFVCENEQIVFGPKLFVLFQLGGRLDRGALILVLLELPPGFRFLHLGELGHFCTMDADRRVAELRSVIGDHFCPPLLI